MVSLIVAGEIGFWVVLTAGLLARYGLRLRRTGAVLLALLPVVDLVILGATVADLRGGATADWTHGLAASYVGFSLAYGHRLVRWADGHAAHRLAGGPKPAGMPEYGAPRARYEWGVFALTLLASAVTVALVAAVQWLVGDSARTAALDSWYPRMGLVVGINLLIAASYTVFPKREK
ncbi:hypothetical protein OU787_21560 [Kitasatospora sp. YST-16]|uniref:hypothetical protein n=1 Tax=Kitasatospora sp. YST-16 TaxID=2998080 RepID=UPI002284C075|nr:hypothetical protein [Kitasatospora sp. YST-16]WAL73866.1 hypothetical protein OU787_21560 [Kitasatospora sp. YST-16]WNW39943.1 hypothetical protein RKE32_21515 [Streptomyces sp. Li-HN-5-13]